MSNSIETQLKGKIVSFGISEMETKNFGSAAERRIIKGYANKSVIDRGRDLVLPEAYESSKKQFMQNPIIFYNHDWDTPIGKIVDFEIRDDGLFVVGEIAKGLEKADQVWDMIGQNLVQSFSIGFIPKDIDYDHTKDVFFIKDLELLEISVVTIPMNADALFEAEGKSGKKSVSITLPEGIVVNYKDLAHLNSSLKKMELNMSKKILETGGSLEKTEAIEPKITNIVINDEVPPADILDETNSEEKNLPTEEVTETKEEETSIACMLCKTTTFKYALNGSSVYGEPEYVCLDCILTPQKHTSDMLKEQKKELDTLTKAVAELSALFIKVFLEKQKS